MTTREAFFGCLLGIVLSGCAGSGVASAPPLMPPAPEAPAKQEPETASAPPEMAPAPTPTPVSSTATYEEAVSTPEHLEMEDSRGHLTDQQLINPMHGVLSRCRVPQAAKVTIKTAVQNGHAIGVSVSVDFPKPKAKSSRYVWKAQAKAASRIIACADHAVRRVSWPPNPRRDSFTTSF